MKVWVVNPYDNLPPEGYRPQRFWLMSRAFAAAGCETTLWTSGFSHANKTPRKFIRPLTGEGFKIVLVPVPGYRANIGLMRIVNHKILAHRWRRMAESAECPDLIVASSPPLGLLTSVRKFAQTHGVPYIVDVMDAWPETFERVLPRFVLKCLGLYAMAGRNYRDAARISVVAQRYRDLVADYGATTPCRLFYHGVERSEDARRSVRLSTKTLRLVYLGNMGASYDLRTVIKTVRLMSEVELDLAGTGPDEPALRKLAVGCDRIRFHGYLGVCELNTLLTQVDAGLVPMFTTSCVGVPYKLADYVVAGLPILNSLEGETADLLEKQGAGFSYQAGNGQSLRTAIEKLRAADRVTLQSGAEKLSKLFDAQRIYADYVTWALDISLARSPSRTG